MASLKERLLKKQKELKSNSAGFKFYRVAEGKTRFRIMSAGEEKEWALECIVFFLGKEMGFVISPHTFGQKCALMNGYNELSKSKKETDRAFAKTFKPGKKFFAAAGRYKDEKGLEPETEGDNRGIKPLMLTTGQYNDMIDLWTDEDEAGDFTHPTDGYDLKMGRTGKGKNDTEYSVLKCKNTKAPKAWRKEVDLEEMVKALVPTYKETKEMLEKFLNLEPEEDDDDSKSSKKKDKKKKKKGDL
jgi:hypothetical protein